MKAIFNNKIIAQSDKTISFEGSTYFPPESVLTEYFQELINHTTVVLQKVQLLITQLKLMRNKR